MIDKTKLDEALMDEAFMNNLAAQKTVEEVQKLLGTRGIDMTIEEIYELRDKLMPSSSKQELSMEDLNNVAGGKLMWPAQM